MSVCLALAVIYSFGYPGSTPLTAGAGSTGTVLAQGTGGLVDAGVPPTGFVGEQQLLAPEATSSFGTTDSLVPGRVVPGTEETSRARADAEDAPGESVSTVARPGKGMLISPLQFLTPSSPFGLRTSPITGQHDEFHSGQDFAAPCGTRVFSADAGVVRAAGWHPWGGGNRVELDHGNGLVTTYNHLEGIAVEAGDRVGAGQVIATVGTTGWSTGCHLHFETILNGAHTDPSAWKLIPMDGSGPVEMPSLVNFTPGTGNDDDTAWVAYLASSEPIHPVAFKSPARVDAEVAAQEKRSTGKASSSTRKTTTASSTPTTASAPTTKPSTPGTSSPGTSSTTPTPPKSSSPTPTPPATDPTPTPPVTEPDPTPVVPDPTPVVPDPTPVVPDPTPVVPDPTPIIPDPTPIVPDPTPIIPDPTPIIPDPTPIIPDPIPTVLDPAPADPTITADPTPTVPDPATTAPPTISAADPLAACDPAVDPDAVVVDPVTGDPVLDPVTGEPVTAAELCASATALEEAGAAGTEPAREPDPAAATAP